MPNKSAKDRPQLERLVKSYNSVLLVIGLEHFHSFFNKLSAQNFFLIGGKFRIANGVRNCNTGEDAVYADHLSDVRNSSDLNGGDTGFFNLSRNR